MTPLPEGRDRRTGEVGWEGAMPGRMPGTLHWSIPWADLMMTMFIFFALLYYFQPNGSGRQSDRGAGFAPGGPSDAETTGAPDASYSAANDGSLSGLYDLSRRTVAVRALKDLASVDLVADKAVRIVLAGDLLFASGRADIRPEAKSALRRVARIIRATPYVVNIAGHTDNVPIRSQRFPTNWELSVIRASRVARFLIDDMKIPGERLFVTGHAYFQPVQPNTSERNRAANRRVEIIISKARPEGTRGKGEVFPWTAGRYDTRASRHERWPWNTF